MPTEIECNMCDGTGLTMCGYKKCNWCGGSGEKQKVLKAFDPNLAAEITKSANKILIDMMTKLDTRETATVLAALRHWQNLPSDHTPDENDIATDGDTIVPLYNDEIDTLCERLNKVGKDERMQSYGFPPSSVDATVTVEQLLSSATDDEADTIQGLLDRVNGNDAGEPFDPSVITEDHHLQPVRRKADGDYDTNADDADVFVIYDGNFEHVTEFKTLDEAREALGADLFNLMY